MNSAIRWKVFAAAAVAINLIAFLMVRLAPRPAVEAGAALDVAVTIPALYFLLIVRGGVQPSDHGTAAVSAGRVARYLPRTRCSVGAAGGRGVRGTRSGDADRGAGEARVGECTGRGTPPTRWSGWRLRRARLCHRGGWRRCWRVKWRSSTTRSRRGDALRDVPAGARAFSIHEQSGVAALFGVLAGVSVMEAALVHLVVMRWSVAAAWGLTALSGYGTVWLTAMARAFVLRPVLVEGGELVVRGGMMWTVRVPLTYDRQHRARRGEMRLARASGERAYGFATPFGSGYGARHVRHDAAGHKHRARSRRSGRSGTGAHSWRLTGL